VSRLTGASQVVTGAAALVLASWWYSHIRRSRRRRVAAREAATPTSEVLAAVSPDAAEAMVRPVAPASEPGPEAGQEPDPG
jgi:hypothetical protein